MAEAKRLHTPDGTPPTHRTLVAPNHSILLLQMLQKLYRDENLCDYTIIAEGQAFRTHRNILASMSDYFRVMLTGTMIEARQDHVDLKGITAHGMKILLDFTYSGRLTLNLTDIVEVLAAASHLQMRTAIELACDFLMSELCTKTCVDILNIGETFALDTIIQGALNFILEDFEKVVDTDQYSKLQKTHLLWLLKNDRLRVATELSLFWQVMKWIEHDREVRGQYANELLQHVRFVLMKPEELVDEISQTEFMLTDPSCRALLDEALHYHVLPNRHPMLQNHRTQVRNTPCMVAFGGRYGISVGYKHNCNKLFTLHDNKWLALPSSDSNFLYAAAAVVNNFLYVCGGMGKPAHARATCQRFDPRTCTWLRLSHMRTRRQSFPLVGYGDRLFAFGGGVPIEQSFDHPPTEKCEVYSIDRNEWKCISPLPERRKSSSACVHSGKIYVCGGRTDSETAASLWCYDPVCDTWSPRSTMLRPHAGHAMVNIDSKLYVIDRTDLSMECYNVQMDEWTKIAAPRNPLAGIARPSIMGTWVYFLSHMQEDEDFKCKRVNILSQEVELLPDYPESVHCVAGVPLVFPRQRLVDTNNNSSNISAASTSFNS